MSSMRRSVNTYRTMDGVADPSPDVGSWRRSLRALDPVETSAPKKLNYSGDLFKPRDLTQGKNTNLSETAFLENEYIKSLQQQIYLLELENINLRSKTSSGTGLQAADLDRMLAELRTLSDKLDTLRLESERKDADSERLQERVLQLTDSLDEERRQQQQISIGVEADRDREAAEELRQRVAELWRRVDQLEAAGRLKKEASAANRKKTKAGEEDEEDQAYGDAGRRSLRVRLEAALDRLAKTDTAVSSEREAVGRLEAEVRRLERRLADAAEKEVARRRLREENGRLRRQAEAAETAAVRPEDLAALAEQNAALEAAVRRLQTDLRTRSGVLDYEEAASASAAAWRRRQRRSLEAEAEAARLRERERLLELQAARTTKEAARLRRRLLQLQQESNSAKARSGIPELSRQCQQLESDNARLARQVRSLETALERQEAEKNGASAAVQGSEARLSQLRAELARLQELQASRWSEVERIAVSIKSTARSNTDFCLSDVRGEAGDEES